MIGTKWAFAVLFFPALPERTRWLRGLDCHAISLATTCRLSTHSQAPHWRKQVDLQRLGDKFFAPKRTNPSTTDPTPQKFPSENWQCSYYFLPKGGHTFARVPRWKWEVHRDTLQQYRGQGSIAERRGFSLRNCHSKSQIASDFPSQSRKSLAISGVRDGHRNRKSRKSLRFRCVKEGNFRRKMTTIVGNRGQSWTSTLCPQFAKPPCRLSQGGPQQEPFLDFSWSSHNCTRVRGPPVALHVSQ